MQKKNRTGKSHASVPLRGEKANSLSIHFSLVPTVSVCYVNPAKLIPLLLTTCLSIGQSIRKEMTRHPGPVLPTMPYTLACRAHESRKIVHIAPCSDLENSRGWPLVSPTFRCFRYPPNLLLSFMKRL